MASSLDDDDVVSFPAEAMKHVQSNEDDESLLLVIAPKEDEEDGAEEIYQYISAVDTPRSQMAADKSVSMRRWKTMTFIPTIHLTTSLVSSPMTNATVFMAHPSKSWMP